MAATAIPVIAGGLYEGMKALYRTGADVNRFMNSHIEEMKSSKNPSVSRSGEVLEQTKIGFGVGYAAPVVLIVTGQLLLGNPLLAGKAVLTAATLTNPLAMTCAAVGAIYWGWGALSKKEQEQLLATLSEGLSVGIEFIRAIIKFVVSKTRELVGEKNFEALKKQVTVAREQVKSILKSIVSAVGEHAGGAMDAASDSFDVAATTATAYWKKLKAVILKKDEPATQGHA